jgi:hypothetical protein
LQTSIRSASAVFAVPPVGRKTPNDGVNVLRRFDGLEVGSAHANMAAIAPTVKPVRVRRLGPMTENSVCKEGLPVPFGNAALFGTAEELRFANRPPGRVAVSGDKSKSIKLQKLFRP